MAAENDTGEKTEEPTSRRIEQARRDGTVAKSMDLSLVTSVTAGFIALNIIGPALWEDLLVVFAGSFTHSTDPLSVSPTELHNHFLTILWLLLPELFFVMLFTAVFGAGATAVQTQFLWSSKLLKPKFSQLNPLNGLKRIFGPQNAVNTLKALAKLAIIGPLSYFAFLDLFPSLVNLMQIPVAQHLPFLAEAAETIFWRITGFLLVLGIADYGWQRYSTHRNLKMTKTEVKDERKSIEGDEQAKMQMRAKALQRARQRMMQEVPTADVVVTNPTHYAVALKYDPSEGATPRVVAKGKDYLAQRIREIASEHGIPVVERKSLARALFANVEVGKAIPYELFAAVAELLAYVYRLRSTNPFGVSGSKGRRAP